MYWSPVGRVAQAQPRPPRKPLIGLFGTGRAYANKVLYIGTVGTLSVQVWPTGLICVDDISALTL